MIMIVRPQLSHRLAQDWTLQDIPYLLYDVLCQCQTTHWCGCTKSLFGAFKFLVQRTCLLLYFDLVKILDLKHSSSQKSVLCVLVPLVWGTTTYMSGFGIRSTPLDWLWRECVNWCPCKNGEKTDCRCGCPKNIYVSNLYDNVPKCSQIYFTLQFPSNQIARLMHDKRTTILLPTSSGGPAFCVEFRGDWKWQREAFCLSAHWGAANFCHVCIAKGNGNPLSRPLC